MPAPAILSVPSSAPVALIQASSLLSTFSSSVPDNPDLPPVEVVAVAAPPVIKAPVSDEVKARRSLAAKAAARTRRRNACNFGDTVPAEVARIFRRALDPKVVKARTDFNFTWAKERSLRFADAVGLREPTPAMLVTPSTPDAWKDFKFQNYIEPFISIRTLPKAFNAMAEHLKCKPTDQAVKDALARAWYRLRRDIRLEAQRATATNLAHGSGNEARRRMQIVRPPQPLVQEVEATMTFPGFSRPPLRIVRAADRAVLSSPTLGDSRKSIRPDSEEAKTLLKDGWTVERFLRLDSGRNIRDSFEHTVANREVRSAGEAMVMGPKFDNGKVKPHEWAFLLHRTLFSSLGLTEHTPELPVTPLWTMVKRGSVTSELMPQLVVFAGVLQCAPDFVARHLPKSHAGQRPFHNFLPYPGAQEIGFSYPSGLVVLQTPEQVVEALKKDPEARANESGVDTCKLTSLIMRDFESAKGFKEPEPQVISFKEYAEKFRPEIKDAKAYGDKIAVAIRQAIGLVIVEIDPSVEVALACRVFEHDEQLWRGDQGGDKYPKDIGYNLQWASMSCMRGRTNAAGAVSFYANHTDCKFLLVVDGAGTVHARAILWPSMRFLKSGESKPLVDRFYVASSKAAKTLASYCTAKGYAHSSYGQEADRGGLVDPVFTFGVSPLFGFCSFAVAPNYFGGSNSRPTPYFDTLKCAAWCPASGAVLVQVVRRLSVEEFLADARADTISNLSSGVSASGVGCPLWGTRIGSPRLLWNNTSPSAKAQNTSRTSPASAKASLFAAFDKKSSPDTEEVAEKRGFFVYSPAQGKGTFVWTELSLQELEGLKADYWVHNPPVGNFVGPAEAFHVCGESGLALPKNHFGDDEDDPWNPAALRLDGKIGVVVPSMESKAHRVLSGSRIVVPSDKADTDPFGVSIASLKARTKELFVAAGGGEVREKESSAPAVADMDTTIWHTIAGA